MPSWPGFLILRAEDNVLQGTVKTCFPETAIVGITTFEEAVLYLYDLAEKGYD